MNNPEEMAQPSTPNIPLPYTQARGLRECPMPAPLPKTTSQSPGERAHIQASCWGISSGAGGHWTTLNMAFLPPVSNRAGNSASQWGEGPLPVAVLVWALSQLLSCARQFGSQTSQGQCHFGDNRPGSEGSSQEAVLSGPMPASSARLGAGEHRSLQP